SRTWSRSASCSSAWPLQSALVASKRSRSAESTSRRSRFLLAAMIHERGERVLGGEHRGVGRAAAHVPATEPLEVGELGRAAEAAPGGAGGDEQIEVVAHEPDDPRGNEAVQEVGPYLGVVRRS